MAPLLNGDENEEECEEEDELEQVRQPNKINLIEERDMVLEYWMKDDWEAIMNMYTNDGYYDPLLCWIRPNRDFLSFLHAELKRLAIDRVVSVGCGCGFLEWLLRRACTGLEIVGYEVDRAWWQGRYGVRPFIDHVYVDETGSYQIPSNSALMTCYFHNWNHWEKYLANFHGDIVIVIGPHLNGRFSCPQPRNILTDCRFLVDKQRALVGGDLIVVARRNVATWPKPTLQPCQSVKEEAVVRSAAGSEQQQHQYNEMRRALVLERIGSAKSRPKPPPVTGCQRMGPRLYSVYKTKKPSLKLGVGAVSVSKRLQSMCDKSVTSQSGFKSNQSSNVSSSGRRTSEVSVGTRRRRKKAKKLRQSCDGNKEERKTSLTKTNSTIISYHFYLCVMFPKNNKK